MPYASRQQKRIWAYFNKPGQHCNKNDMYSDKWEPRKYSFPSGPKQDRGDIMWEKIKFECFDSIEADCKKPNSFECKKRRHYKCPAPNPHFPGDVENKELVNHLKEFHPDDYTEFLRLVKFTMKANNENSKKYLKLSHGIVKSDEKQVIIRFPLSRSNPVVHDVDDVKNVNTDDDNSMHTTIKEAYQKKPTGAYAGNYERPIRSQGFKTDLRFLPDKFENFVSYRHNTSQSCNIFDVNKKKYKSLDVNEKIDSYIIKEEVIATTIVGPVTDINKESVIYTCRKNGCQIPCLCQICVQQIPECNAHKFKHPALFDKMKDHLLLRTPHNYDINNFKGNTFQECYVKNKNYVHDKQYLGYHEPVEEVYLYAGIKKDCTACTNDLYYHSAYHFVYHDKCKFCRYSSYRFEGITTQKEFCERVKDRLIDERRSCHICYKIFSSENTKKNHIKIVHQNKGKYLCDSCGRIYGSQIALEYHLSTQHKNEQQWMCKRCLKTFNSKHSLNVHVKNVHDMKTIQCKICSKVFKRLSHFLRHQKYLHGIYRSYFILDEYPDIQYYNCEHCSFKSRYKTNLHKHIETIHKDVEFPCSKCEFISNRHDNLERHIKTIHGDVKYKCNECEFISNRNDAFIRHTDTVHGDKKSFFCPECDSAFKRKDKIKRHVETKHTEEFKYNCNKCDYLSNRKDNMKRHQEKVHCDSSLDKTWIPNCEDSDQTTPSEEDEEDSLNQTWLKRKSLNQTWVKRKEENSEDVSEDVDGDFDKTWTPNNNKDDET